MELHHIVPQKSKGKYSLDNILPLHQICHQQVTYGNQSLERFRISLPEKKGRLRRKKTQKKDIGGYSIVVP